MTLAAQRQTWRLEHLTEVTDGPVIKGVFDEHRVSITADGRTWIRKRVVITGDQPLVAEAIAWLLAMELGLPVPHAAILVAPDHNDTSWLSQEVSPMLQWDDGDAAAIVNIEALGGVIALDTLTLNNDRHQGNLIVQALGPGQLQMWAIDSGNALVGWPGDFLERRDQIPDASILPVRRIVNTLVWQRIVASAQTTARSIETLTDATITRFVEEACTLGLEPKRQTITEVLRHRRQHIVDLTDRYLIALAAWAP